MKANKKMAVVLLFALVVLSSCGLKLDQNVKNYKQIEQDTSQESQTDIETANSFDQPGLSDQFVTFENEDFSLQYPAEAIVESPSPQLIKIVGPDVSVSTFNSKRTGPAYILRIEYFDNPEKLSAEKWARSNIFNSWRKAKSQNLPFGDLPISDDGIIEESKVNELMLGGQLGFKVNYFGFDCYVPTYYLTKGNKIITLSYYDYPIENEPLAPKQKETYSKIINSLKMKFSKE